MLDLQLGFKVWDHMGKWSYAFWYYSAKLKTQFCSLPTIVCLHFKFFIIQIGYDWLCFPVALRSTHTFVHVTRVIVLLTS